MAAIYIALLILIIVALAEPILLLVSSAFLRIRKKQNQVSGLNFESAEHSSGIGTSIMSEYFHYFTGFLAFEVVAVIFVLWVYVEGFLSAAANNYVLAFMSISLFLEYFVVFFALRRVK